MSTTTSSAAGAGGTSGLHHLYEPNVPDIPPAFSEFFTSYTGIKGADLPSRLLSVRDRAYNTVRYPCLGRWRFLQLDLSGHPLYDEIVSLLTADLNKHHNKQSSSSSSSASDGIIFLDLGCCLGQDLRKLIWDVSRAANGPPLRTGSPELNLNVFGADLKPEFIDIGYELFLDEGTLPRSQFITPADVFDDGADAPLTRLDGKVSLLNCTAVFHLFNWDEQVSLARRILRLLNREGIPTATGTTSTSTSSTTTTASTIQKQALIVGWQVGDVNAGEYRRATSDKKRWAHNEESWERLWNEAVAVPEWQDVIKGVRVVSRLTKPVKATGIGEMIDRGLRSHSFSVWVEFR